MINIREIKLSRITLFVAFFISWVSFNTYVNACPVLIRNSEDAICVINEDFKELNRFRFSESISSAHLELFGSNQASSIIRFFYSRVSRVRFEDDLSFIAAWNVPSKSLVVGREFFGMSRVERLGALLHEARHSENNHAYHSRCPTPFKIKFNAKEYVFLSSPYAGEALSCDSDEEGAYFVHFAFLMSVAESCLNCTGDQKDTARIFAIEDILLRLTGPGAIDRVVNKTVKDPQKFKDNFDHYMTVVSELYDSKYNVPKVAK